MIKCEKVNVKSSPVKSFFETLDLVKIQVGYLSLVKDYEHDRLRIEELCRIIAEVYCLDPELQITIDGAELPVSLVQEIYSKLDESHIDLVYEKFSQIDYGIKNKKTYLRTMLYNTAFEMAHTGENEFNAEGGI